MDNKTSPAITLRAEFKPLISVVNILIEFPRCVIASSPRLTLEAHTISVETKQSVTVFHLEQLTLKPATCRGLRWNSQQELQLTAQAEWISGETEGGDADRMKTNGFHSFNQELLVSKIETCQSRCYCVGCGAQILKPSCNFKRVLPLPSENWTDFADIWFCHHHHTDGHTHMHSHHSHTGESTLPDELKQVKNSGLSPRLEDCLVSSLYMLVSARQVKPCSVQCTTDRLVCKRCGNFLGFVKLGDADSNDDNLCSYFQDPLNGVYKLYFHAVTFRDDCEEVPLRKLQVPQGLDCNKISSSNRDQSIEGFLCSLLKDQSRLFTSFRFIIDSLFRGEGQSGVLILLWLLDQELAVYESSSAVLSTAEEKKEQSSATPSSTTFLEAPSQSQVMMPGITPCKYMKLLYKATFLPLKGSHFMQSLSPNVFTAWQKDNTVHSISLPYPLCKQLISLLVTSTKELTKSQRNLNGFHVGYLKTS